MFYIYTYTCLFLVYIQLYYIHTYDKSKSGWSKSLFSKVHKVATGWGPATSYLFFAPCILLYLLNPREFEVGEKVVIVTFRREGR